MNFAISKPLLVKACVSSSSNEPKKNNRRSVIENAQSKRIERLKADFDKITKREMDASKKLLEEIFPIKIEINDAVLKRMKDSALIKVEFKDNVVIDPEILDEEEF